MAVLPKGAPRAQRPSADGLDFGGLARGVQAVGAGVGDYAAVQSRARAEDADRWAQQTLTDWSAVHDTQVAERAATYDGKAPGLTREVLDGADQAFRPLLDGETDLVRRKALEQRFDGYRANLGSRLSGFEAAKRAEPLTQAREASEALALSSLLIERDAAIAAATQARAQSGTAGAVGYAAATQADYDAASTAISEKITDPALKARFDQKTAADRYGEVSKAQAVEEAGQAAVIAQTVRANIDTLTNGLLVNPAGYDAAVKMTPTLFGAIRNPVARAQLEAQLKPQLAHARVQGLLNNGQDDVAQSLLTKGVLDKDLDPTAKQQFIDQIQRNALAAAKAEASGAGGYDGDDSAAPGFAAAADFVIDQLEGGEALVKNDNGRGATKFGINQTANPDLDVPGLTRKQALGRFKSQYWDAVQGDRLPPALALVAFDAAVNQGPEDARKWLAQSGGDVGRYLALREADYRKLARSSPAQAKNLNGWLDRLGKIKARAERVTSFLASNEGFTSDPINYAMGDKSRPALLAVASLDRNAPFSGDAAAVGAWGESLKMRRAQGQVLQGEYGAPPRMLTNAERAAYAQAIQTDPMAGIRLAGAARTALGDTGAMALLREVSKDAGDAAPVTLHLADLAAGGSPKFAADAARGLQLKAQGAKLEADETRAIKAGLEPYRGSLSRTPEVLLAAQQAAELAMIADKASGIAARPDYYAHRALGGVRVNDINYGGGAVVRGKATILPRWLNGDYVDDALKTVGATWAQHDWGPHFANGQAMTPAQISRGALKLLPSGRYQLVDPQSGAVAVRKNGQPFDFAFDNDRALLAQTLGGKAVLGGKR